MSKRFKEYALLILAGLLLCLLLLAELLKTRIFASEEYGELLYILCTRTLGALACMILVCRAGFSELLHLKTTWAKFFMFLPCMAVAVNNFPFISYFSGDAYINYAPARILIYALSCAAVGFFEEMAFRGCIFSVIWQRLEKKRGGLFLSIVASSAVFGIVHLVNIAMGASFGATVLQVGYSFLIGALCSVLLVRTKNIWYCVVFHSVYNFAGGVVPECGGGVIWTYPEIILTTAVALPVTAYVIYLFVTHKEKDAEC